MGGLALSGHTTRRTPYESIINHENFHRVSPAYAKRFKKEGESDEEYVERLRKELEDKFLELGPETVIGCTFSPVSLFQEEVYELIGIVSIVVAEPVVGATTGAVGPPPGYFKAMKSVCKKYGALFILDEVMSGMGRVGTLHAWETFDGEAPDIQAVAKGLGGGCVIPRLLLKADVD